MPITDLGSHVTTGEEIKSHWAAVDADRIAGGGTALLLADGYSLTDLTTDVGLVETAITGQENLDNAITLATAARDSIDALPEGAPLPPVHPGEVLLEEFIRPHGLTPIRTARRLGVPRTRIERLVAGATGMTDDTALRLERLFGASAEFWLRLQADYDLGVARRRADPSIGAIEPLADRAR